MPKITWSDKLTTGIRSIDGQHRELIELINTLQDNIERGELTQAGRTLQALAEKKMAHCRHEEELLSQSGFPFYKPHKLQHENFIRECTAFHQRAQAGEHVTHKALAFVKPWMVKHIRGDDLDYANFVRRHIESGAEPVVPWHLRTLNRFFPKRGK